jgi:hypothetical protein
MHAACCSGATIQCRFSLEEFTIMNLDNVNKANEILESPVSSFFCYFADGSINWEATDLAIKNSVNPAREQLAAFDAQIEALLDAEYDKQPPGTSIDTPTVAHAVATKISGDDLKLTSKIKPFVVSFAKRSPRFRSDRGRNGGLTRIG